uniref:Uncharacterized protein n=1 Tax=Arundo donax TaxID=35708 RepID=A0A0A8YI10_ARUDO
MYILPTSVFVLKIFSIRTLARNPVPPVMRKFFPPRNSAIPILPALCADDAGRARDSRPCNEQVGSLPPALHATVLSLLCFLNNNGTPLPTVKLGVRLAAMTARLERFVHELSMAAKEVRCEPGAIVDKLAMQSAM